MRHDTGVPALPAAPAGPRAGGDAPTRLLDTVAFGRELGVPVNTVRLAVRRGEISALRIGREMFFRREELDRFIARLPAWSPAASR